LRDQGLFFRLIGAKNASLGGDDGDDGVDGTNAVRYRPP